ncbi:MAG: hypothetical protein ACI4PE_04280 [Bacilli bacterium]
MKNYNEVPNIISGKDLDYLSDIFNWNYSAYKKSVNAQKNLKNEELVSIFEEASNTFYNNMNTVLNILNQGGQNE